MVSMANYGDKHHWELPIHKDIHNRNCQYVSSFFSVSFSE